MWIFHRARNDLPVVLGWRHPWEHAEDPWASYSLEHGHVEELEELQSEWDTFQVKAENPEEDDDEEEEEEDDDDDEEEEDDEEVSMMMRRYCVFLPMMYSLKLTFGCYRMRNEDE
jgi:hypothetical protein